MVTHSWLFEQIGVILNISAIAFFALLFLLKYYVRIKGINMKGAIFTLAGNFAAIFLVLFIFEELLQNQWKNIFFPLSTIAFPLISLKIYFKYYLKNAQVDAKNLLKLSFKTFGLMYAIIFVGRYILALILPNLGLGPFSRIGDAAVAIVTNLPIYALGFLIPIYMARKSFVESGMEKKYALKLALLWFTTMLGPLFLILI